MKKEIAQTLAFDISLLSFCLNESKLFLCVCKRFNNLTLDPVHCICENIYFEDLTYVYKIVLST